MNIHNIYAVIFKIWRVKRHQVFLNKVKPKLTDIILDVGGTRQAWVNYGAQPCKKIISLNIEHGNTESPEGYDIECVVGDACELSYSDNEFDIVYSNSVIEHVGDYERQKLFAEETLRVGKKLWIQTPAYECPIEPHYLAPFVHWLPVSLRRRVLRYFTPWGLMTKPNQQKVDDTIKYTQLLKFKELQNLYPGCDIYVERFLGVFPKSYTVFK